MESVLMWGGLVVLAALVLGLVVLFGAIPGVIARQRGHRNATAILVCGLVGLVVWPAWVVALVWAFTSPSAGSP